MLEFTWDSRQLEVWRGGKVEKALVRVVKLGGNQAIRGMQKGSTRYIRGRKLLRENEVVDGLPLLFPSRKAALQSLAWTMRVSGKPISLAKFPHIQTKRGVLVRVNVGGGTRRIPHAFVATMKSGHRGIFIRKGKDRLPIQDLWTTRLSDSMKDEGVIPEQFARANAKMQAAFERGMKRELGKLRRKGDI